ncbi:pyruvate, water dikinase [Ruminococcaceae bacterium YRB3002]|nr:pyruvate, water dikinase [Ruminococcaceae bacterium YRB3002]
MIVELNSKTENVKLGNKGASLREMKNNGYNVPDGFVLDTDEYDAFIELNGLQKIIDDAISSLNKDNIGEISHKVHTAMDNSRLPENTVKEIKDRTRDLKLYAVRSSGSKEDLDKYSFAGQYQTFLNIGGNDVAQKVIGCYKSMFSEVILSYLVDRAIDAGDLKMSVVVQEMVDSDYSGICFTLNPATGVDTEELIEVSEGLGENIVSGKTAPEQYFYDWYKGTMVRKDPKNRIFTDSCLEEYAQVFFSIMKHYGYPCDIEFAVKNDELFILQCRRITKIKYSEIKDLWTTADFKDGGVSATVCTPYMWSLYEYIWEYSLRKFIVDSKILRDDELPAKLGQMYYGRPYWNLSAVKKTMSQIIGYREREFDNEYGIIGDYEGDGYVTKNTPAVLAKMAVIALEQSKILKDRTENNERYKNELLDLYYGYKKNLDEGTIEDITKEFVRITKETYLRSETTYFWQIFLNTIHQSLYKDSLLKYVSESEYLSLLGSIDNISHLLPFYDMWDITRHIRSDAEAIRYWKETDALTIARGLDRKEYFIPEVRSLIDKYGYHSDKELDITYPCYYEEPHVVIQMVKDMALLEDSFSPVEDKDKGTAMYQDILDKIKSKVSAGKYNKILSKVTNMRQMLWWREEFRDVSTRFYYMLRMYTIEYAKKLELDGVLEKGEDVWFLKVGDLWDYIDGTKNADDLAGLINRNKQYYNAYRNYISENEIGNGFTALPAASDDENTLKGLGANNGTVAGVARVIEDFSQIDRLKEGDILVTRFTDTGWTPKFAILSGIVTEYGGILCHAAIVSREYGIPAIVCCKDAMSKIRDGQKITVDGTSGTVRLDG